MLGYMPALDVAPSVANRVAERIIVDVPRISARSTVVEQGKARAGNRLAFNSRMRVVPRLKPADRVAARA